MLDKFWNEITLIIKASRSKALQQHNNSSKHHLKKKYQHMVNTGNINIIY